MENCVKKQVKMVNNLRVDCPRSSVGPGVSTLSVSEIRNRNQLKTKQGKKESNCHQQLRSNLKPKLKPQRLWLSGFFQAQLRMMKFSKKKQQVPLINHQKQKGKMTLFDNYSPLLKKHRKMPHNLKGRRSIHDLPNELLSEILKRLPVKYILRCRCVQKSWYSLLQSPMFITLHLNYQKNNILTTTTNLHHPKYLFFYDYVGVELTIRFDDVQCQEYCKIEFPPGLPVHAWFAQSYGLVCVSCTLRIDCDYNRNIYLWNPLIHKYKTLPVSPLPTKQHWEDWEALAFGFVLEVNDYVVVHIIKPCLPPNSHSVIIGVYSLNTNSWKKLTRNNVFICRFFSNDYDVVFINGAAYWVGCDSDKHKILMCFDTKTDILTEISLPDWLRTTMPPVIYPFGQSIAYFVWEHGVNHWDMWVLKDDLINGFIWEKKLCVSTSDIVCHEVWGVRNNGETILARFNNHLTYNHEANDFVDSCDCWTPEARYTECVGPRYVISPFVESLVLFDVDCNC